MKPLLVKLLDEYLLRSTIHGVFYIGQPNRPYIERILWALVVLISIGCGTYYISKSYSRWQLNPVMVTLDERPTSMYDVRLMLATYKPNFMIISCKYLLPAPKIPIPAMTICPPTKFRADFINVPGAVQFLRANSAHVPASVPPPVWSNIANSLPFVCPLDMLNVTASPFFTDRVDFDIVMWLKTAAASFAQTFSQCEIKDTPQSSCAGIFREVFTSVGLCYTFNGLMPNHLYRNNT